MLKILRKKYTKKLAPVFLIMVLLFSISASLFSPVIVLAADGGEWIDRTSIKIGNDEFTDTNIWDTTYVYTGQLHNGCTNEIDTSDPSGRAIDKARYIVRNTSQTMNGDCVVDKGAGNENLPLANSNLQVVSGWKIASDAIYVKQDYYICNAASVDNCAGGPVFFQRPNSNQDPNYNSLSDVLKAQFNRLNSNGTAKNIQAAYIRLSTDSTGKICTLSTDAPACLPIVLASGGDEVSLPFGAPAPPSTITPSKGVTTNSDGISSDSGSGTTASRTCESANGTIIIG
ncbi:MAG: hypothetical protein WCJ24_03675, partial [Candidatus Saccharibacteria bacterium]